MDLANLSGRHRLEKETFASVFPTLTPRRLQCSCELAERHLGHKSLPIKDLIGSGKSQKTFDRVPIEEAVKYAGEDADITLQLRQVFGPMLAEGKIRQLFDEIEMPRFCSMSIQSDVAARRPSWALAAPPEVMAPA